MTVIKIDPLVLRAALAEAGGDVSRLRIQRDGSVVVVNNGRRPMSSWSD